MSERLNREPKNAATYFIAAAISAICECITVEVHKIPTNTLNAALTISYYVFA